MQYILTQEEYSALITREALKETEKRKEESQAAFMILKEQVDCWQDSTNIYGYCDDCPLVNLETICTRFREYSK